MAEVTVKEKKTRVRKAQAATITEQAKKLSLTDLIAHYKAVEAEIIERQGILKAQLDLANSI